MQPVETTKKKKKKENHSDQETKEKERKCDSPNERGDLSSIALRKFERPKLKDSLRESDVTQREKERILSNVSKGRKTHSFLSLDIESIKKIK